MENRKGSEALTTTLRSAIQALGRGFDVTSDVRLLYCKGAPGSRLVRIEEGKNRDLEMSDGFLLPNVPADIECSLGEPYIDRISVCSFHQVAVSKCLIDAGATIMQRRLPVKQMNFNICDLPWRHVMAHRDHLPLRPPPSSQQVPPVRSLRY
ncbi:hypothetical protein F2Q70_00030544 [Brassica cretica]|uniref:Uncharacterized protein n=1 Tax=Brassica cretica TaxID=69181 RepID=A0A8S9FNX1_BRACR|nr:hypothetical protein F2Q70_00030544 [Brassica cretica]